MTQFLLALIVFLALHSVPAIPAIRQRLVGWLGRKVYLALHSLVSIIVLVWVFRAALQLDHVELWPPAAWQAWAPIVLTPLAFFLLVAGLISPNPGSISLRRHGGEPGAVVSITRHPVLWGFALWAIGHLIANGDLRSVILFGTFGLFAVLGMVMAERRNADSAAALRQSTSILPFAALLTGRAHFQFDGAMLAALLLAAAITAWLLSGGHAALFGADPLAMTAI